MYSARAVYGEVEGAGEKPGRARSGPGQHSEATIFSIVVRQAPQSVPAVQASATSVAVEMPSRAWSRMVLSEIPLHWQTITGSS